MRRHARLLLTALALAACTETPTARTVEVAQPTAAPVAATLQIADLALASRTFTAAEQFGVTFRVKVPGTGKIVAYWLATRLGEQRYAIESPLPVIANGMVELTAAGPLPNQREAGRFTLEFWVEDEAGAQSNSLTQDITVQ